MRIEEIELSKKQLEMEKERLMQEKGFQEKNE